MVNDVIEVKPVPVTSWAERKSANAKNAAAETATRKEKPHKTVTKRNFKRAPYSDLADAAKKLGKTVEEVAVLIGYSDGAVVDWRKMGQIPLVASYAIAFFLEDYKRPTERLMLVRPVDEASSRTIETVAKQFGASVAFI